MGVGGVYVKVWDCGSDSDIVVEWAGDDELERFAVSSLERDE